MASSEIYFKSGCFLVVVLVNLGYAFTIMCGAVGSYEVLYLFLIFDIKLLEEMF